MFLPAEIILVLAHFAPAFSEPTYQKALVLVVGRDVVGEGATHGDGGVAGRWG